MHMYQPSIEVSSLSIVRDLILLDEGSATKLFTQMCGLDPEEGICAIRTFQDRVDSDRSWLTRLGQIDSETARENPKALMRLLTEGFGLYEVDAMDVILRMCEGVTRLTPPHLLN